MNSSRSFSRRPRLRGVAGCWLLAAGLAHIAAAGAAAQQPSPFNDPQVLRVWGYSGLSPQLLRWEAEYRRLHPGIRFDNQLHGAAAVMAGLYNGVADVALMGREIWPVETMAYRWVYQQPAFGVTVATAGLHAPGQLFTPVVIVNAANPLRSISVSQLDAIYGSEHRAAPANLRTWGELGLQGRWASQAIHVYGFGPEDALGVYFRQTVLRSDFKPNAESHLLSDRDGSPRSAATRIAQAVARDPYAIGYTALPADTGLKVLPLDAPSPVVPSEATLAAREYPLTRSVWLYFRRTPATPLEPKVDQFVRFLLSAQAQALVGPPDQLVPLTAAQIQAQLQKLDRPMPKSADAEDKDQ
jgi:phosphate transport system substrate-binding protein